jgi:NTP pyrophosphatase (non-canonical NTP hydrolase)
MSDQVSAAGSAPRPLVPRPGPDLGAGSSPDPEDPWALVEALWRWLDAHATPGGGPESVLPRLLKLQEEVGEVAAAVIGATGQNPRKGTTHTWDDVQAELCDVTITALVALRSLTPDARAVFTRHLTRVAARSLGDTSS